MSTPTAPRSATIPRGISRMYPHWFYLPAGLIFVVLFLLPALSSIYFAFTRWTVGGAPFTGWDNIELLLGNPFALDAIRRSLIFAAITTVGKVVLGLALALLFTSRIWGNGYLRLVVFFPVLVSSIGVAVMWKGLLAPDGLVNSTLALVGVPEIGWLYNTDLALYTIAGVEIWRGVGFAALIFSAGIVSVPVEYLEAARLDGAGRWASFRRVTLPLLGPAVTTVVVLSIISGLKAFDLFITMGFAEQHTTEVLAQLVYSTYSNGQFGIATAANLVLSLLVAAVAIPFYLVFSRREVEL